MRSIDRVLVTLQLRLQAVERAEQRSFLLRQLPIVLQLVLADRKLKLVQGFLGRLKLRVKELQRAFGMDCPVLQVLLDKQAGDPIGDTRRNDPARSLVANSIGGRAASARAFLRLDRDVLAHDREDFFLRQFLSFPLIKMELVDHACELPRVQDLLGDIAQTVIHIRTHRALYIFLRYFLRIHDNQSIRPVHAPQGKDSPHAGQAQT